MCKPKRKKIEKFEQSIREITKHNRGVSADYLIAELNSCLCGWKLLRERILQEVAV